MSSLSTQEATSEERKAKREARRAKQRDTNIGRALMMHEARLAAELHESITSKISYVQNQKFLVGCSGWFYWHWRVNFYPVEILSVTRAGYLLY